MGVPLGWVHFGRSQRRIEGTFISHSVAKVLIEAEDLKGELKDVTKMAMNTVYSGLEDLKGELKECVLLVPSHRVLGFEDLKGELKVGYR